MSEPQDWRARRWEDTHQRIYETALRLFQEQGFEQVAVGVIASGAGVSVPTFYAHYQSKEHIVMQLPTAHDFAALLAGQPTEFSLHERIRRAVPLWLGQWTPEFREDALARWRIVAATPALRTRAAEFERTSGGVVADALPTAPGEVLRAADAIVVNAYMSAYTAAMLAWADCNGEHKLEELMEESFDALQQR
ncbi:TetR/AcrR family transcriptional regulator [Blastococcus sp. CT_GayMR16]|uniref:TetR/AcrR family transcriptional regulator n=1 Tax=Blastococcus sp. CT_GayMR16 TaxID=2559607 RepID=UPI00142F58F9|nr:TetR/AcrR family transcriptional regulator [Blastococcus sp. CT_GayMR16]